jgi:hypothetical protein
MKIYIIEETHLDYLENHYSDAVYHEIIGFITDKEQAEKFCNEGGRYTKKNCWAVPENGIAKYRLKEIFEL